MPASMGFKIAEGYVLIEAEIDEDDHVRSAHRVGRRAGDEYANAFGRALDGSGAFWLRRFRRALSLAIPSAITITLPMMTARITAILGLVAAITSLASSVGLASASIAVLIPATLGLVSVIGILRMMLGDLSKGVMKQTIKALDGIKDKMREVAVEAARPGFEKFLKAVVTLGPMATRYVEQISKAIGDTAAKFADLMKTEAFRGKLQTLLYGTARGTREWLLASEALVDVLVTIGAAVVPQFERLSKWIRRTFENWREFLDTKHRTGELAKFFQMAGDEAARWGRIFRDLLMGIVGILVAAHEPGQRMADALERMAAAFRAWAWKEETHGKIAKFLHFLHGIDYIKIFQVAAAIVAFGLALKGLVIGLGVAQGLLALLALGPVGATLTLIAGAVGALALAFTYAYIESENFRRVVGNVWRWVKKNIFPVIEDFINWLMGELIPALKDAVDVLEGPVRDAWETIRNAYEDNKKELRELFNFLKTVLSWLIRTGIPMLAKFAGFLIDDVSEAISTVIRVIGFLIRVFHTLQGITRTARSWLASPISGAAGNAVAGIRNLIRWIGSVIGALRNWRGIASAARSWLSSPILGAINGVIGGIQRVIGWVRTAIGALQGMWNWLNSHVFEIKVKLPSIPRLPFPGNFGLPFGAQGGITGARGMQHGGMTGASVTIINERGPEAVRLPTGSTVIPHGQTMAMLRKNDGQRVVVELHSDGSRFSDMLMEVIRHSVRVRGGDVQFVLGD